MRFRIGTLLLIVAIFALAIGWAVDHAQHNATVKELRASIELQETDIRYGVATVARATSHWHLLDEIDRDSASKSEFRGLLIVQLIDNLYSLSTNETGINVIEKVPADYWAFKILNSLGCKTVQEFRDLVRATNHRVDHSNAVPQFYDSNSVEYKNFDDFLNRAIVNGKLE
jgi:hypothetical protein